MSGIATPRQQLPVSLGAYPLRDVVPIFTIEGPRLRAVSFMGSGFRLTDELLVTCWHCVSVEEGRELAVLMQDEDGRLAAYTLADVEQDGNGADLATARIESVDVGRVLNLELATAAEPSGTDVWAYGYPFTTNTPLPSGEQKWELNPRYLQGYITRSFMRDDPHHPERVLTYELDMRAPEGLSGAPIIAYPTFNSPRRRIEVIGVVYGRHGVEMIEEFASVDPDTGERRPEIQRVESFALAHYTSTLLDLTGAATDGLRLADYVARLA